MNTGFIQVTTTTAARADAERIARALVEGRLAACVQIAGPVSSTYWWRGDIETAEEFLCIIKTRAELFARAEAAIREMHPYETPEIIATPITGGSADYLKWLAEETAHGGGTIA